MVLSRKTSDISPFCEFVVWDWVESRDKQVAFPSITLVLRKHMGPSIDVGPAMIQHIMKNMEGLMTILLSVPMPLMST